MSYHNKSASTKPINRQAVDLKVMRPSPMRGKLDMGPPSTLGRSAPVDLKVMRPSAPLRQAQGKTFDSAQEATRKSLQKTSHKQQQGTTHSGNGNVSKSVGNTSQSPKRTDKSPSSPYRDDSKVSLRTDKKSSQKHREDVHSPNSRRDSSASKRTEATRSPKREYKPRGMTSTSVSPMAMASLEEQSMVDAYIRHALELHPSPLAKDAAQLSTLFTSEREDRRVDYMRDPRLLRAYMGVFAPLNAAKIARLLHRLQKEGLLLFSKISRVLDVGAGPLTGIAGVYAAGIPMKHAVGLDHAAAAMRYASELLQPLIPNTEIHCIVDNMRRPPRTWLSAAHVPKEYDLIIVANAVNEIGDARRAIEMRYEVVMQLLKLLSPSGRMLIVEPAMRMQSRALMEIRDRIVAEETAQVLAPCVGADECPLLKRAGDWCHGEVAWSPPPSLAAILRDAKMGKAMLHSSILVLGPLTQENVMKKNHLASLRLIGGVMHAGSQELRYACGQEGLVTLKGRPKLLPIYAGSLRGELVQNSQR